MDLLPHLHGSRVCVPVVSLAIGYAAWGVLAVVLWVHRRNTMIFDLPPEWGLSIIGVVLITTVLFYVVFYLVSYQAKKARTLEERQKALAAGTDIDAIELERIKSFHWIYAVSMLLGIAVVSFLSLVMLTYLLPHYIALNTQMDWIVWGFIVSIVLFTLFDHFVGHPIADGTFKAKVLDKLREEAIAKFLPAAEATAEAVTASGIDKSALRSALREIIAEDQRKE